MTRKHGTDELDPGRDPLEWDHAVEAIVRAAEPELERRRSAAWVLPDRWARPVLAVAASVILLACGSLYWSASRASPGDAAMAEGAAPAVEDALYPPVVARWIGGQMEPTVEDLVFASVAP